MSDRSYKATLSQSQGREGWSVIFRHPVLLDRATGKPGRRVRRGLGTRDEKVAKRLIAELNQLLADRIFWEPSSRSTALGKFAAIVVDIFYSGMTPDSVDAFFIRESFIPRQTSKVSKYRQVLMIGSTGGGKTTLVRQLLGTDPRTERFPSTSTAKTTVADTEIVLDAAPFRAVVTFLPRDEVRDYVEECMSSAVLAAYHGEPDGEILRRMLNHVNQRFRLPYVLGNADLPSTDDDEEEELDEDSVETLGDQEFDQRETLNLMRSSPERLRSIALRNATVVRQEMESPQSDERVFEELFEESLDSRLREDEDFQTLADGLLDEIERRFELLTAGDVEKTKQGWPRSWTYESGDRQTFLKVVSRFSSNWAPHFGTLLTPLVSGIRVAGPFAPTWLDRQAPLILFDVEGLGHTVDSAASLPTALTRLIEHMDAVLLVDNGTQPMQAAPVAAMRSLVTGGQAGKLIFCFTHFDRVTGDNLPTFGAKRQHVLASAENALTSIGEQLGTFAERGLRKRLEGASFFLGGLDQTLTPNTKSGKRTIGQLKELLRAIDEIVETPELVRSRPVYDRLNLVLAVKQAAEEFHAAWNARLGIRRKYGITKTHWLIIKALTRRFAEKWADEYMHLKPLADLHKEMQESLYRFLQNPVSWTGDVPSDDGKQQIFDELARHIGLRLLVVVVERVADEAIEKWQKAFALSGKGSTFARADVIATDIFAKAAPIPDVAPTPDRNKFLHDVIDVVRRSAAELNVTLQ